MVTVSRKAMRYALNRPLMDAPVADRLKVLGEQYPRYRYLMLHAFLRREDLVLRTYRLYTDLGIQLRTKRRIKLVGPKLPMEVLTRTNQRW